MENPLIVIEGIDGVGKTTLAKGLADALNGVYQKSPSSRTPEQRLKYEQVGITTQERFDFYLAASYDDLKDVEKGQSTGKLVIRDRFISSTIIHHQAMDPLIDLRTAKDFDIKLKRIQILLTAPRSVIIKRLLERKNRTHFEENEDLFMKTQELFAQTHNDIIIDTGKHDIPSTLSLVQEHLNRILSSL